ncbi:beta-phosphoglucomutase [Kordiimonas gwangyangensis]|uniref:beta-phosphoglucomutase n=1 Tax=Kordiimonas gwangyangensis TaxID=288022 RepID=UPI0003666105|nr:beta-phosphoglucomutase [Kordiimonas gwangyangensis]
MSFKACIFDLDGVITDTAHYHFLAWQRLAHSLDLPFDHADNDQLKGVGRMESLEFILAKSDRTFTDEEKARLAHEKNEDYKNLIREISPADMLPGILDAFDWLEGRGIRIGLASASRNAPVVIAGLGIAERFDYVADAGAIPNGKPAPDIFLDVVNAFGLTGAECIGVEDAAAGVTAIKAAGMRAIAIGDSTVLAEADIILPNTDVLVAEGLERIGA